MSFGKTLFGKPARYATGLAEAAPGVHAWLQPNGELGESNAALVVGDGESLLVDTLWDPDLTGRMLDAMAPLTAPAPITTLINTHADGDHTWGNQLLGREVEIVASEATAESFDEVDPKLLEAVRNAPGPFGEQLVPYDFGGIELTPPTRTFTGNLELDVGGRTVDLVHVGPAHTPGDTLVWLPDVRTLIAADIVFNGVTPIMWAGPVDNWLAAIDTALALDPAIVVPGHGPPGGPELLLGMRDYWTWLRDALGDQDGVPLADAARALIAESPFGGLDDPARTAVNAHVMRAGGTVDLDTSERLEVLGVAAEVRASLT